MLVGLLIGILIFIVLTWLSRHRASAVITRPSKRRPNSRAHHNRMGLYRSHGFQHLGDNSLASAHLNIRRQASVDADELLGGGPFKASTFHPPQKGGSWHHSSPPSSPCPQDVETPSPSSEGSPFPNPENKRQSFWLGGNNGLKGYLPTQTPPPAYDSVIHAFQETQT